MYNEIKQNIIKNFLNKGYLYTCGCKKEPIINKIIENDSSAAPQNDSFFTSIKSELTILAHY